MTPTAEHTHVVVRLGANGATSVVLRGSEAACRSYALDYTTQYQHPGYLRVEPLKENHG